MSAEPPYLDASAVVKLLQVEPGSHALQAWLSDRQLPVSSRVLVVEVHCAARRLGHAEVMATAILEGIGLLRIDEHEVARSVSRFEPPQRPLDAIHLATADRYRSHIGPFVTYDVDQAAAAGALGLEVVSPA